MSRQQVDREQVVSDEQVQLQRIGDGQWRVLDTRLPADDVRALLGFVEQHSTGVRVTFITEPGATHTCHTLEEAKHFFVTAPPEHASAPWAAMARARHAC